jgi:hypothetical protein
VRAPWAPSTRFAPYGDEGLDTVDGLLFADDSAPFEATGIDFGPEAGAEALTRLATGDGTEARIRALACRSLRSLGAAPEPLPFLGVIVEVGLKQGIDTMAVYADGRVRYLNHAGGVSVIEVPGIADAEIGAVLAAGRPVAEAIGPWTDARRPPPGKDAVRLSFLVGDELRFGEGPMTVMARDAMAGPIIATATALLLKLTQLQRRS